MLYKILHDKLMISGKKETEKEKQEKIILENLDKEGKLKNIIRFKNPLKIYFNKWKLIINLKEEDIKEDNKKPKIITVNKVIYKKGKIEKIEKDKSPTNIITNEKEQLIQKTEQEKNKIIEVIKKRISNYFNSKQLLKKYYNRWLSKVPTGIIRESIVNKIINKKVLSFKKKNKHTTNDETTINDVKKNLFRQENEIENDFKLHIPNKKEIEQEVINSDLYEDKSIDKKNTTELPEEQNENDILLNNIMRLSLSFRNNEENENINEEEKLTGSQIKQNNENISEQNENIVSEIKNKKQDENKDENIEIEKQKKLKKIMKNKTPLRQYFNIWKNIKLSPEIKNEVNIYENQETKEKYSKIIENIFNKRIIKKFFDILKDKGRNEIKDTNINEDINKEMTQSYEENMENIEKINVENIDNNNELNMNNYNDAKINEITNSTENIKYNENKDKETNKKEESEDSPEKITTSQNIIIDKENNQNNCIENPINPIIENEKLIFNEQNEKEDNEQKNLDESDDKKDIEIKLEKDNNNLEIPMNSQNDKGIIPETLDNQIENEKVINNDEQQKEVIEQIIIEKDSDNNKDKENNVNLNIIKQQEVNQDKEIIETENRNNDSEKIKENLNNKIDDNINIISNINNNNAEKLATEEKIENESINPKEPEQIKIETSDIINSNEIKEDFGKKEFEENVEQNLSNNKEIDNEKIEQNNEDKISNKDEEENKEKNKDNLYEDINIEIENKNSDKISSKNESEKELKKILNIENNIKEIPDYTKEKEEAELKGINEIIPDEIKESNNIKSDVNEKENQLIVKNEMEIKILEDDNFEKKNNNIEDLNNQIVNNDKNLIEEDNNNNKNLPEDNLEINNKFKNNELEKQTNEKISEEEIYIDVQKPENDNLNNIISNEMNINSEIEKKNENQEKDVSNEDKIIKEKEIIQIIETEKEMESENNIKDENKINQEIKDKEQDKEYQNDDSNENKHKKYIEDFIDLKNEEEDENNINPEEKQEVEIIEEKSIEENNKNKGILKEPLIKKEIDQTENNNKNDNNIINGENIQEKIEIIKTYSIDDIEESENDINKLSNEKNKEFKIEKKPNEKIVNEQIINTLDSNISESMEKEKENNNKNPNKIIYSKPKSDIKNNIILEKYDNNELKNFEQNILNKPEKEDEIRISNNEIFLPEKNGLNNEIDEKNIIKKDENDLIDLKIDEDIIDNNENKIKELDINNKEEKINTSENNIITNEEIKNIDLDNLDSREKILKLISIINPLNKYFKRWKQILYKTEIEIPHIVDNFKNIESKPTYKNENIIKDLNQNDKNINKIYSHKNNIKQLKDKDNNFFNNNKKEMKIKNIIIKYINEINNKDLYYYFKNWRNKTISNDDNQLNTIITSINTKSNINRIKFIKGKKILPFEKLEKKLNEVNKSKTPRIISNILTRNENKQKKKLLSKLIVKKIRKENNSENTLRRYMNIWKEKIKIENEDINDDDPGNKFNNNKVTSKKRNIVNIITDSNKILELIYDNHKGNILENDNILYIKQKAPSPSFIPSIKNNQNTINYNIEEEDNKDDIINNENDFNINENNKKFILPIPNKEEIKECPLIINTEKRKEEFEEIKLDSNINNIKKTPKIPQIKFKKKIIHNRYHTDNEFFSQNNIENEINPELKFNYIDIDNQKEEEPEQEEENNSDKNYQLFHKKITITSDNDETNSFNMPLQNDPSIKNKDFAYRAKGNNIISYKKINKKVINNTRYDNEKIGRNYNKNNDIFEPKHAKSKTYISDFIGIKNENNNKSKKFYLGNKYNKKEYTINYNNLILCEEIVYKCNDAFQEIKLDITPVQKPKKVVKRKYPILFPISGEKKESLFVQRVLRYKKLEKKYGFGNNSKSPMRLPINPNDIELHISALSPLTRSSKNFHKKEIRRFEKIEGLNIRQDICITDRGEKKDTIEFYNSPKMKNSYDEYINNNKSENTYSDNYENEIIDPDLNNKINDELKLKKKLADFYLRFLKNLPENSYKRIQPNILYNILKSENMKLSLLKLLYIYEHFKMNKYSIKKSYLKKWKKSVNFIDIDINNNFHILNKFGHCLSAQNIKEINCGIHSEIENEINCTCLRTRILLKKVLLRHMLLKRINIRKYYLFKWYKNTFKKIRPLYVILS